MDNPLPPVEPRGRTPTGGNGEVLIPLSPTVAPKPQEHPHVPVHYAKKTGAGAMIFAVLVAAALGAAIIIGLHSRRASEASLKEEVRRAADQPLPVDVVRVQFAPAERVLSLPGEARAFYETTIFARTNGYVSKWLHDIGDRVKEGEVLATIETPELDDQYAMAQAKLKELQAQTRVAQTTAEFAKISYERYQAGAPDGVVTEQDRDQKKSEFDADNARVEAARAQADTGQADVNRLATLRTFKKVIAPFDGTITQRHIDVGALVTAGSTTNTSPLFTIAQSDQIRVFVDVPQSAVPTVKVGMQVTAESRELPGRKFVGKVDRTAESVDPESRTLRTQVLVPNADMALMPGMFLQVTFSTNRLNPPPRIPAAALAFGPNGPRVAVVAADGRVSFRDVTIARDLGDSIEIGSGLTGNETVALNVGNQVTNGERVDPHSIEDATASGTRVAAADKSAAGVSVH